MVNVSDDGSAEMLRALRLGLRAGGWTAKRIGAHFGTSEASVKRWLAGKGVSLSRLGQLALLAGMSLPELADASVRPTRILAQELTLAQENALSEDSLLSFLFMAIMSGEAWEDFAGDFGLPPSAIEAALARLEKLALIDRLSGGRVRSTVDRNVLWRKSPLRNRFETQMKPQFLEMNFGDPDAVYASEVVKLSARGAAALAELMERHRRELHRLVQTDRRESLLPRRWHAVLFAARLLDGSGLRDALG